jgi:hypothetical protein
MTGPNAWFVKLRPIAIEAPIHIAITHQTEATHWNGLSPHCFGKLYGAVARAYRRKCPAGRFFDKMNAFIAGSFAFLDPNVHHYAMASGETIVQVHGQSPLQFNYVNPDDDPTKSK